MAFVVSENSIIRIVLWMVIKLGWQSAVHRSLSALSNEHTQIGPMWGLINYHKLYHKVNLILDQVGKRIFCSETRRLNVQDQSGGSTLSLYMGEPLPG